MHEFRLRPPAPFNFAATAAFLSPGEDEEVDVFDGKRFTRLLEVQGRMRLALVSSLGTEQRPELIVTLMNGTERDEQGVVALLTRMLGLRFDLGALFDVCRQDEVLYGLSSDYYGLRPAQRMHPFETTALAVARPKGVHFFRTGLSKLAGEISYRVAYAGDTFFAFPNSRVLAKHDPEELVEAGLDDTAAAELHDLATAVNGGELDLVALARLPSEAMIERLAAVPGVGLLGAQLTAILGYGRLECFPTADPLILEWIGTNYDRGGPVEPFEAREWAERWGKIRGLVAFYIYAELMDKGRI